MTNVTGATLLLVVGEPFSVDQKELILQRIAKGLRSLDDTLAGCDVNKELARVAEEGSAGEEGPNGERTVICSSEGLSVQILFNPQLATLQAQLRTFLTSGTKHRHLVYGGQVMHGTGSWVLQDDLFHYKSFAAIVKETDVENSLKQQQDAKLHMHAFEEGEWSQGHLTKLFSNNVAVEFNPEDKLAELEGLRNLISYLGTLISVKTPKDLLLSSDVVGNIRFNRPTLYVFPGCNGDSALFGINGFNLLVNGGYSRKACFWDFTRHLDRIDAMLVTHLGADNLFGVSSVLDRKAQDNVHPEIGYVYMNGVGRKKNSPNGDTNPENGASHKPASLSVNLAEEGHRIIENLHLLGQAPGTCVGAMQGKELKPVNLYHKVGHGTLDMFVLNPMQDNKEMKEFFAQWNKNVNCFSSKGGFPVPNMMSVCALLVWRPASQNEKITRILFPGNAPQAKIFEGLDKLKTLDIFQHDTCSELSLKAPKPQRKTSAGKPVSAPAGKPASAQIKRTPPPATARDEPKKPSPPPTEKKAPISKLAPQSKTVKEAKNKKAGTSQKEGSKSSKPSTQTSSEKKSPVEPAKPIGADLVPEAFVDDVPEIKPEAVVPVKKPAEVPPAEPIPAWTEPEPAVPAEFAATEEPVPDADNPPQLIPVPATDLAFPPETEENQEVPSPVMEDPVSVPEPEIPESGLVIESAPEVKHEPAAQLAPEPVERPVVELADSDEVEADQVPVVKTEPQPNEMPEALPDPVEDDMFAHSHIDMHPNDQFPKTPDSQEPGQEQYTSGFEEPKEPIPDRVSEPEPVPVAEPDCAEAEQVLHPLPDPSQFETSTFEALAQSQDRGKDSFESMPSPEQHETSDPMPDQTSQFDEMEKHQTIDVENIESSSSSLLPKMELCMSEAHHSPEETVSTLSEPEGHDVRDPCTLPEDTQEPEPICPTSDFEEPKDPVQEPHAEPNQVPEEPLFTQFEAEAQSLRDSMPADIPEQEPISVPEPEPMLVPECIEEEQMVHLEEEMPMGVPEPLSDPSHFGSTPFETLTQPQDTVKELDESLLSPEQHDTSSVEKQQTVEDANAESDSSSLHSQTEMCTSEPDQSPVDLGFTPSEADVQHFRETMPEDTPEPDHVSFEESKEQVPEQITVQEQENMPSPEQLGTSSVEPGVHVQDLMPPGDEMERDQTLEIPNVDSDSSSLPSHTEESTSESNQSPVEPVATLSELEAEAQTLRDEMPEARSEGEQSNDKRKLEEVGIYDEEECMAPKVDIESVTETPLSPSDKDAPMSTEHNIGNISETSSAPQAEPSLEELGIYDSEPLTSELQGMPTSLQEPTYFDEDDHSATQLVAEGSGPSEDIPQSEECPPEVGQQQSENKLVDFVDESSKELEDLEHEADIDEDSLIEALEPPKSQIQPDLLVGALGEDSRTFDPNSNLFELSDGTQDLPPLDCGNTTNPFLGMNESDNVLQSLEQPFNIPHSNGHMDDPQERKPFPTSSSAIEDPSESGTHSAQAYELERDSLEKDDPERHSFDPVKDWGEPMGLPAPDDGNPKKAKKVDGATANGAAKSEGTRASGKGPTSTPAGKKATASGAKKASLADARKSASSHATPAARKSAPHGATGRAALDKTVTEPARKLASAAKKPPTGGRPSSVPATKAEARTGSGTKRTSVGISKATPAPKAVPLKPVTPFYVDLTYVPTHGDFDYIDIDFFRRVRARYYVISALCPNPALLNAFLDAKEMWEDSNAEVTIIPTYDTEILRHWMALNREKLSHLKVDVAPSASRCTIQLQDHETSCAAYRLEF